MKKFRFPLRPVAILREHHQARTSEAFAVAVRVFVEAEARLAAKCAEQQELEKLMNEGRRQTFRPAEEISLWAAYRRLCDEEAQAGRAVHEARQAMEARRETYLEAHRAVKVVEKLEQKARADHRFAVEREAQLETDELAGLRVARRRSETMVASS